LKNATSPGRIATLWKRGALLIDGLTLTVVGMLAVIAFLLVLVFAMAVLQRVVERLGGTPARPPAAETAADVPTAGDAGPPAAAAAAAAALHAYRSRKDQYAP
jgi:sodium pump decarboxylase gamma subunit